MGFPTSRPLQEAFAAHHIRVGSSRLRSPPPPPPPPPSSSESGSESWIDGGPDTDVVDAGPSPPPPSNDTAAPQPHTLGILVTTTPLTDGVEKAMASSRRCLMYMCLEEGLSSPGNPLTATDEDPALVPGLVPTTKLKQIAWNAAAAQAGLEGYDIVTKYSDATLEGVNGVSGEATFMYQGRPVQFPT